MSAAVLQSTSSEEIADDKTTVVAKQGDEVREGRWKVPYARVLQLSIPSILPVDKGRQAGRPVQTETSTIIRYEYQGKPVRTSYDNYEQQQAGVHRVSLLTR